MLFRSVVRYVKGLSRCNVDDLVDRETGDDGNLLRCYGRRRNDLVWRDLKIRGRVYLRNLICDKEHARSLRVRVERPIRVRGSRGDKT